MNYKNRIWGTYPMKLIIAGSRDFNDYQYLVDTIAELDMPICQIISGTARGADQLGERYGREHGIEIVRMPANWDLYGKSAGYRRNEEMAKVATDLLAFWDGESRGTKHMIDLGNRAQLNVVVVRYK